ncbi:unnamed protein product [Allacma fusca]|uniref:C2 domain-containing protein n=1 Tax=Allacma fusca TaxID=39272 RepID=A0A8J2Q6U6_9HEXA|nr:unnamed protein product [Allacma fusca]
MFVDHFFKYRRVGYFDCNFDPQSGICCYNLLYKLKRRSAGRDQAREDAKKSNRAELNLFGLSDGNPDVDDDDNDLEAELLALLDGGGSGAKRGARKPPAIPPRVLAPVEIPPDIKSDDEDDDDIDESELEAELQDLTAPPKFYSTDKIEPKVAEATNVQSSKTVEIVELLGERLGMYEKALAAEEAGSAKTRRLTRAIKTLKDLVKKAKAGGVIDEADIPPVIATKPPKPEGDGPNVSPEHVGLPPSTDELSDHKPSSVVDPEPKPLINFEPELPTFEPLVDGPQPAAESEPVPKSAIVVPPEVEQRIKEYKKYAVALKRSGDMANSIKYLKLAKTLESAANSGATVDLASFPELSNETVESGSSKIDQVSSVTPSASADPAPVPEKSDELPEEAEKPPADNRTMLEHLQDRLEKYQSEVQKAQESDNSSKARRMGRIVKQYQEAIQLYKKGKPVPFEDLPTPPNFPPLPIPGQNTTEGSSNPVAPAPVDQGPPVPPPKVIAPQPVSPDPNADTVPKRNSNGARTSDVSPQSGAGRGKKPSASSVLQERQLNLLLKRKQQFKDAAINAKKRGDVEQAREYLRTTKGIDKLIQANQCGFPVDMQTVPAEPEAVGALEAENFELVSPDDCIEPSSSDFEAYSKLEDDLKKQMKMCIQTRDHYKAMGDIASANRFEKLAIESKKDLDVLRLSAKQGGSLPKFQYVQRLFSITECNTDLAEDEIEIGVIQGINYKVANPTTVDTFVKVELAYPSAEEAQINKTSLVRDTNNPVYNATFKMSINRSARNFQRFVHRHGVKLEVWSKGGFLRSNTLIGTATAKLVGLESKCTVHDAFEVLEGRKSVGKLEMKIRLRDPVLAKQISQRNERWLSLSQA